MAIRESFLESSRRLESAADEDEEDEEEEEEKGGGGGGGGHRSSQHRDRGAKPRCSFDLFGLTFASARLGGSRTLDGARRDNRPDAPFRMVRDEVGEAREGRAGEGGLRRFADARREGSPSPSSFLDRSARLMILSLLYS